LALAPLKDVAIKLPQIPERTLRNEMSKLRNLGLVVSKGSTKNMIWIASDSAMIWQ